MIAAAFPTETAASQCPRTKPRPALPGDLEACRLRGPIARPRVWTPGTASSKQGGLHRQSSRIKIPLGLRPASSDLDLRAARLKFLLPWQDSAGTFPFDNKEPVWRRPLGFGRKASSQSVISKQEGLLKELEELKFEIQKCQFERDELYQILDLYIYDEWDHRLDVELPVLQSEHEMRMMAMQMMTNSISDAMERYKELIQVNSSYRVRHSQLLREQAQLRNYIQILLNEKRKLLVEQTELPASSVEAKRLCEEAGMNICDPSAKQQQV